MEARIERPRVAAFAVLGLAVLSIIPFEGWWPLVLFAFAILGFAAVGTLRRFTGAPEYAIAASWGFAQIVIASAATMTGGRESHVTTWLLVPLVTLPARFGMRGVIAGGAFTAVLATFVTQVPHPVDPLPHAYSTIYLLAALVAVAILSTALMRSDLEHRTEAVIDGLTGMLNRRALSHRLEELEAQARITRQPIAILAADLDHFKQINDRHGHAKGDAVLVDVAYRLRKHLRAFDLAYRVGGEEFLILLPGATVDEAATIAETLRAAIDDDLAGGLHTTISFGVAGAVGEAFVAERVLAEADAALYDAKAAGRNRVVVAGAEAPAVAA